MALGASCLQVAGVMVVTTVAVVNVGCDYRATRQLQLASVVVSVEDDSSQLVPVGRQPFLTVAGRPTHGCFFLLEVTTDRELLLFFL